MSAISHKFQAEFRVKSRKDFLRVQQGGKKTRSYHFLLCASSSKTPRLGITVTTKVHKRANVRNRIKRQIREFFRKRKSYFILSQDVVIIAMQGAAELENAEIRKELNYLFKKAGILERR